MIALIDGVPLVELKNGLTVTFERDWLVRSVVKAAAKAGYPQWWLAEHVSESVMRYLVLQWEANVVKIDRLGEAVREALKGAGYPEVARHVTLGVPGVRFSLTPLAAAADTGYELAFFEHLGRQLDDLLARGVTFIEIEGLTHAVKLLHSRKHWGRDCERLRADIVGFIRGRIFSGEVEVQVRIG